MTPGLTKLVTEGSLATSLVQLLSPPGLNGTFQLVSAVVDEVPSLGRATRGAYEGISVLRGSAKSLFDTANHPAPRSRHDRDAVGALTFGLGDLSTVTLPLARTIFHNGKPSTLTASRYEVSSTSSPKLQESEEPFEQRIDIPVVDPSNKVHLRLPIRPVTLPVQVTESFGNILRRVEVDGKNTPASAELEKSIGRIQDAIAQRLPGMRNPFSVWAVVKPKAGERAFSRNWSVDQGLDQPEGILSEAVHNGGRLFRLCKLRHLARTFRLLRFC